MTLRRSWLVILIMILLTMTACVVEDDEPVLVDPTGLVTYVHPTSVFTLSLPQDWVIGDTSDNYALNVSFSPPHATEPLLNVYVVNAITLAENRGIDEPLQGMINPSNVTTEMDSLASIYQRNFYAVDGVFYKEIDREIQSDGSLRVGFVLEASKGTTTYNDFIHVIGPYFVGVRARLTNSQAELRVVERIINTLVINATSEWASIAEPSFDGSPHDLVEFSSLNHWADRTGAFVIVGQLRNNAEFPVEFVRVNALLYDDSNRLLIEQDDFVPADVIMPGEDAPFTIVFPDGLPDKVVRYDLEASARYTSEDSFAFYGPDNFAISSDVGFDDNGLLVVDGQLRNEGEETASFVKVIVMIFDGDNRLVGVDTTIVDNQRLGPGDISTFSVRFFELGGAPQEYRIIAQGVVDED